MSPILKRQGLLLVLPVTGLLVSGFLGGCNPYERRVGEYNAGAVDPIKFPGAYLGEGGRGNRPGQGTFQFIIGYVEGKPVVFYPLAFNGRQSTPPSETCANSSFRPFSNPLDVAVVRPQLAYVFDPKVNSAGQIVETAPDSDKCVKPEGYSYDRRNDPVRFDRQGNIFRALPTETENPAGCTSYVPIVNEVPVTSMSNPCQDIKSEATLVTRTDISVPLDPPPEGIPDAKPTGRPSDRYLAYAIIDPAADVQPPPCPADGECMCPPDRLDLCKLDPATGLGPQRWGWYQQYLLAYLDGGYIPLQNPAPASCKSGKCLKAQRLYVPKLWNAMKSSWERQDLGLGRDVMQYKRGQDGYSPICEVWTFEPSSMEPSQSELKATDIEFKDAMGQQPRHPESTGELVYCLQTPTS